MKLSNFLLIKIVSLLIVCFSLTPLFSITQQTQKDIDKAKADFWVSGNLPNEAMSSVNMILCFIDKLNMPDFIDKEGNPVIYRADVDEKACESLDNADSSQEAGQASVSSSNASVSGTNVTVAETIHEYTQTVNRVSRANNTSPQVANTWLNMQQEQNDFAFEMNIFVSASQSEAATSDDYGVFDMHYTMMAGETIDNASIAAGQVLGHGKLVATNDNGVALIKFIESSEGNDGLRQVVYSKTANEGVFVLPAERDGKQIRLLVQFKTDEANKQYCQQVVAYQALDGTAIEAPSTEEAFNAIRFEHDMSLLRGEKCFSTDKANAIRHVWRYGTYAADGSRYDLTTPSFPLRASVADNPTLTEDLHAYAGYWGSM